MSIRPDIHARFLAIVERARKREQAEWEAFRRGPGRPIDEARVKRSKGITTRTRLPDPVRASDEEENPHHGGAQGMLKFWLGLTLMAVVLMAPMGGDAQEYGSHRQRGYMKSGTCDNYQLHTEEFYRNNYSRPVRIARTRISNSNGDAYTSRYDGLIMAFTFFGDRFPGGTTLATDLALPGVETILNPGDYIYITYWCGSGEFTVWGFIDYTLVDK